MTTFLKNLTLPVVSANLDASKEPEFDALFTKSTVLNVGGEQIVNNMLISQDNNVW